ncbi:hypothetical protein FP2506_05576 [Fulvimarina pelagi HTCC2506]|uniref:Uncharacterized protein n=1 Tax=Fulvimarina pelagi HTCC2506 TaxID=314231 RepID=Q0G7T1_9HYPH|nr:DUF6101 family protein [Fulvimarina pelagi]EAU42283.1 hypothetical protein FP2506_05576 [Fulvimarina pelagi HTCC2506]
MTTNVAHSLDAPKPNWANEPVRIDPTVPVASQSIEILAADGEMVRYQVSPRGAVIHRKLQRAGLPVSIALSARAFKGIAARAMEHADGSVTVTLELHHHSDPALCVPLLVASDLYDVAADWRSWADFFGLPMLMVEADGSVVALEETVGTVKTGEPAPRRRSSNRTRRPRFLARRKPGGLGMRMVVAGEEIIARR